MNACKYFGAEATAGARGGMSDAELERGFERIEDKDDTSSWLMDSAIIPGQKDPPGMQQYRMHLDTER